MLLRLSDSLFLPLNVSDYSETLRSFLQAAQQRLGAQLEGEGISLGMKAPGGRHGEACTAGLTLAVPTGPLVTAVEKFEGAAMALNRDISELQKGTRE